ncbi:mucin-4 [Haliaeetus albicilla]|uniref:mucin-4 n=1 Tax=Haliaeetus albicilla TaxID=8969 RepID=UPI0037E9331D
MGCRGQRLLWTWVLWGLWVLPAQAGETGEQPLAPTPAPAEPGSISPVADSTGAKLPPDLGMCQAFPTTTATQPVHPSPAGRTATSVGSHGSGSLVPQVTARALVPARTSGEQGEPPSVAVLPGGLATRGSPQAGLGAGVSSPGAASHLTSVSPAPTTTWHRQLLSLAPTGHTVGLVMGSGGAGPATATSSPAPGVPAVMETSEPPSNSSTAPKQAVEVSRVALDNIPGEPVLGTTVPMHKGTVAEPPMGAAGALKGAPPAPGGGLSPPVARIPAAQPVPGAKASSSVTGKLTDTNEVVQLGDAVTAEKMLGPAWTTVPSLPQDEHSTGTSPPSIGKSSAEPYATAMLPSQDVMPGLDEATSPLATAASISWDAGSPLKPAAASASPATGLSRGPPSAATEEARTAAPLSADPPSASFAKVTFSSATIGIGAATEPGTRTLSKADHNASQDTGSVPPAQLPPALSPRLPGGAMPGAGETLSPSHSVAPGTAGDGLPGANAVTHPQATALAPGAPVMAMDVTAAEHVPTTSFPALGSTGAELVSVKSEPSARATAGTTFPETEATPVRLSTRLTPHTAPVNPGGPSPGPFAHSTAFLLAQTPSAGSGATTAEVAAGGSPPARPSVATSLSLMGAGGTKPDGAPRAAAAPTSSLGVYGIRTGPAAKPFSLINNTPINEVGVGTALLASDNATTMLWDTGAMPTVPDASPSRRQPGPTAGSAPLGTGVIPGPALAPPLRAGPQHGAATWSPSPVPAMGTTVPSTPGLHREASIPVALQAGTPPLLEGSATAGMALGVSPSSIPQETAAGMSPLSLATSPSAMGASGDPHPDYSTAGRAEGMTSLKVATEENPGASAVGPAPSHAVVTAGPSREPPARGTDAPETRPPGDLPLLAPRGGRSAPPAMANPSPALATASPLPSTATGKTSQPTTPPPPENAAVEGGRDRSQPAGHGSTTQAALGSTPVENTRASATTGTPDSGHTTLGTAPPPSAPATASVTAQPSMAASDHSYHAAEPTTGMDKGMDLDMDTVSPTMGNRAVGLSTAMAGAAEPGASDATPLAHSAPGSKSPVAVAIMGTVSPTAPELVIAPSPGLTHNTSEAGVTVSPPVPRNTHPLVVTPSVTPSITITGPAAGAGDASLDRVTTPPSVVPSSASTPHSPRVTPRPSPEATDSTHDPASMGLSLVTEDEPMARVSSLAVGHTHAWETTAVSRSDAGGATTARGDTTPSESGAEGAAPLASTSSTHVPVSNTAGRSPATMPATSMFPSNAIPPATSASRETFAVTAATTAMPSAPARATSTTSVLSLAVTRNKAGRSGQPVLSPAERNPSVETTAGSWSVLSPSPAITVPSSPLPSLHSPAEGPATAPSSLLGVGASGESAAGWASSEPATGTSSPMAVSSRATGQAASTSSPSFWTPLGAPARGEKTAMTAGSTTAIAVGSTTAVTAESTTAMTAGSTAAISAGSTTAIAAGSTAAIGAGSTAAIGAGSTTAIATGSTTAMTAGSTAAIGAGSTTAIAAGSAAAITAESTAAVAAGSTMAMTAGSTTAMTAGSTTAIAAGSTTAIAAGSTAAIGAGSTTAMTAGSTMAMTAGSTTAITAGSAVPIAAGSTTAITARTTTAIAAGSTTAMTAGSTIASTRGSTTAITAGSTTAMTAGSAVAIAAKSTMAITAGSTMAIATRSTTAIAAGSAVAITAGSTTAISARSTTAITAGSTTAIAAGSTTAMTAGSTTAMTAGSTTAIAAGSTTAMTAGSTTAIAADSTTAITAGSTVAVAPTAPVSPAKEVGGLPAPGTVAPVGPPDTTSPATNPSPAFGTQRGLATAPSTTARTTAGHRNPAPEPQPSHGLIILPVSVPAASLYPFGMEGGDQECVQRMVDFNSPLFKPEIGFPFGKSLRDALYFTDNGQIIFPPTDNYVLSNPNPPPRGFSGWEGLPMVAAFWDDADFSQGVGTTWYQEYSTLSSAPDPLIHDVEAKIEKYLKTPYIAKWTLKVTWEKAPAYPSQGCLGFLQTSTYQAVLTTDGNRSFALLLYQDGGMRWDYTKLAEGNVLIGFSSGDGYAQNNELTQKPPAVKYRPDQHSSTGTGVRGLWIYRLDSRSRVNYRLQCLAWLDAEPAPATWNDQLPPCPCSEPQAELDPRYRRSKGDKCSPTRASHRPRSPHTISGPADTSLRMLRTASPSPAGAGVRCLYQDGSLLEGWQERAWSPPIHPATDGELEAFDWCCRRVGKPLFCARFAEKRPRVGCEGYVPPTPAGAFGDPHITTLDGLTYTFNGLGDFVLLLASDAQTSFMLHGRTVRTGTAQATNFMAFAAQYNSATTTTVEWTLGNQGDIQVLLNDETIQFSYSQDMGAEVYYSPGVLLVNASSIMAVFDAAIAISISAASGILSVVCSLPDRYRNSTKGLLGVWDHDPADDFQMPNGTSIPVNSSEEEIYSYGMTWAVGEHSLFAQPLDSPVMNFTPIFLSQLRQENESQYQLAASWCRGSKECIYDSLSTGDVALGLATQSLAANFQQKKAVLNAFPPVITGDASLTAFRTERVRRQYRAVGVGARFVPHLSPELNISENGTLTWEPHRTAPLTVNLEAVGSNNLSALLQLHFTLCSCSRSQECDYSDTVTLRGSSLQPVSLSPSQLAACRCEGGYSGPFCQDPPDPCAQGCFPGVGCDSHTGCGPCPAGLTGDGRHCSGDKGSPWPLGTQGTHETLAEAFLPVPRCIALADIDECAEGMACPGNATCTNTVGSYTCSCPPGEEAGWDFTREKGSSWEKGVQGFFCLHLTRSPHPAGEGPGCGSACGSRSCPEGYCSNGGHCHLHPVTCTPACACPPAFTDQRCLVAGGDFRPLPSTDLPRRSVQLRVRTLQNATAGEVNGTVSAILDSLEVKAFQSNTNITQTTDSDGFTFTVVSEFAYDSRSTIIRFLNNLLPGAIISAFNGKRGRREAGTHLLFQHLHRDNITDVVKRELLPALSWGAQEENPTVPIEMRVGSNPHPRHGSVSGRPGKTSRCDAVTWPNLCLLSPVTVAELRHYFPCGLYGYKGYQLHYVGTIGFVCISPCKMGYCQHGGQCQHLPEGPTCSCLPFSIFSPTGARCEQLAVSLAAFLGILLGALALLCLLLAVACLALRLCRRHCHRHRG